MKKLRNEKQKSIKGITLISLVITIIILIILAGVSISLILGKNGLFSKAKEATEKFLQAQKEEEKALAELEMEIKDNEKLSEITDETPVGTQVKLPNEWITTDENGERKISVRAIAVENGEGEKEAVPVPKGFYYVGGTIESGVVISDDPKDQNKYADYEQAEGEEGIPAGVVYDTNTGIPKAENQLSEEQKKTVIFGNQFVWIPVEADAYKKVTWTDENGVEYKNAEWDQKTPDKELEQIKKYGGFYIGRYEAGTSNITLTADSKNIDFSAQNDASSWENTNFSIRDELNHTATGKITSKAGEIPYYHADYYTASKLCEDMYQTDYVKSTLVTGTMWDVMMNFIAGNETSVVTTGCTWGNYNAKTEGVTFETGRGRYASVTSSGSNIGSNGAFTKSDDQHHYGIRTTASTEGVKKNNLYDIAGNLWEWTQEAAYVNTTECYMHRGGSFNNAYYSTPACFRANNTETYTSTDYGFRPALYIM